VKSVLDASVAIANVLDEATSPAVRRWIERWLAMGSTIVVPRHFWLEIVNSLAVGNHLLGAAVIEAVHQLREFPIETHDLDEAGLLLTIDAVERHGLTAFDAQYLVLAELVDAPLVTIDKRLANAAGSRAIDPTEHLARLSEGTASYVSVGRPTWPDYSGAASYLASLRAQLKASATST
jgi:predicted nucleic acid-binding protein